MSDTEKAKAFLREYDDLRREMSHINEEIERIRESQKSISVQYSDLPKGTDKHDLSDYIVRLEAQYTRYLGKLAQAEEARQRIMETIERLTDADEKQVLRLRYVKACKWEDICFMINVSWKHTHRIHGRALIHIAELLENDIE